MCRAARIRPRTDPTNRSLKFARNRVQLEILPKLAKINPRAAEAIARFAQAAAELQTEDDVDVATALARARDPDKDALVIAALGSTVRSRAFALAWREATGRVLGARHRRALDDLTATEDGSRSLDLPGGRAIREYGLLRIVGDRADATSDPATPMELGREIIWNGWRLVLGGDANGAVEAEVPKKLLRKLVVRQRRDGDRTTGRARKKLQDLFTDAKIPASQRSRWPVIASEDAIWWVPGLTEPPKDAGGTRLAVAAPAHFGNELWTTRVRQVASKVDSVATRPRKGPSN